MRAEGVEKELPRRIEYSLDNAPGLLLSFVIQRQTMRGQPIGFNDVGPRSVHIMSGQTVVFKPKPC